jgi:signal transduction histidine kinase
LLVLTVVVPTACVLWFMSKAISNERLAVRQRLGDAYRAQLAAVRTRLQSRWSDRVERLSRLDAERPGSERFAAIVRDGLADSAIFHDPAGRPVYPTLPEPPRESTARTPAAWTTAEIMEYRRGDPSGAARAYAQIARRSFDVHVVGRALQAQARCLAKAGDRGAAIEVLTGKLAHDTYRHALDAQGRLIQLDALLRALELMSGPEHPAYRQTVELLAGRLDDYTDTALLAHQRRFLMNRLRELAADAPALSTLAAEEIASAYLDRHPTLSDSSYLSPFDLPESWLSESTEVETPSLRPTLLPRVWQLPLRERRGIVLFTHERLLAEVEELSREQSLPAEVSVAVLPPGREPDPAASFVSLATGKPLAGWRLSLVVEEGELFEGSASRQSTAYIWTGVLFIVAITALAALVARYIGRQIQVARIKNDLVATVTHELKTPLSSMRMLVDTLLDGHYRQDQRKTREYLTLIARENVRLSRLIDHFLTFSRMERNKKAFDFGVVKPDRIVEEAVEAVRERFESAGFELRTEVAPDLPEVVADPDAMVTVLLNLLDNSYKYSDGDRRLTVRACKREDAICFEVEDHGIGMSSRTVRKIFDRFYQADRSLARRVGGCGLGLSIVKFVVDAHGGAIHVESKPGEGSTFTVTLPRVGSPAGNRLLNGVR